LDIAALRQVEGGAAVEDVCRSLGIFQATFYIWQKKYGDLDASEVHCLRQLKVKMSGLNG
jgi:putative transposase